MGSNDAQTVVAGRENISGGFSNFFSFCYGHTRTSNPLLPHPSIISGNASIYQMQLIDPSFISWYYKSLCHMHGTPSFVNEPNRSNIYANPPSKVNKKPRRKSSTLSAYQAIHPFYAWGIKSNDSLQRLELMVLQKAPATQWIPLLRAPWNRQFKRHVNKPFCQPETQILRKQSSFLSMLPRPDPR